MIPDVQWTNRWWWKSVHDQFYNTCIFNLGLKWYFYLFTGGLKNLILSLQQIVRRWRWCGLRIVRHNATVLYNADKYMNRKCLYTCCFYDHINFNNRLIFFLSLLENFGISQSNAPGWNTELILFKAFLCLIFLLIAFILGLLTANKCIGGKFNYSGQVIPDYGTLNTLHYHTPIDIF